MGTFGWSYPPGCSHLPWDDEDESWIDPEVLRKKLGDPATKGHDNIGYCVDEFLEEGKQEIAPGLQGTVDNLEAEGTSRSTIWLNTTEAKEWLASYDKKIQDEREATKAEATWEEENKQALEEYEQALRLIGTPEDETFLASLDHEHPF